VVTAALALTRSSGKIPSIDRIAERAKLTERTVFNLFEDRGGVVLAVLAAFRAQALARLPRLPAESADLEGRLAEYFDAFAPFLEDYARVRWAALTASVEIPDMDRGVVLDATFRRLEALLAPHRIQLTKTPAIAAALRAAIDPMTWRIYRVQQGLDRTASAEAMCKAVLALARSAMAS
jgi:AcrR family transcriptional regulator